MSLDDIIAPRGRPALCVSDNGTELTSLAILRQCQESGVERHYIAPGNPSKTPLMRVSTNDCATNY